MKRHPRAAFRAVPTARSIARMPRRPQAASDPYDQPSCTGRRGPLAGRSSLRPQSWLRRSSEWPCWRCGTPQMLLPRRLPQHLPHPQRRATRPSFPRRLPERRPRSAPTRSICELPHSQLNWRARLWWCAPIPARCRSRLPTLALRWKATPPTTQCGNCGQAAPKLLTEQKSRGSRGPLTLSSPNAATASIGRGPTPYWPTPPTSA